MERRRFNKGAGVFSCFLSFLGLALALPGLPGPTHNATSPGSGSPSAASSSAPPCAQVAQLMAGTDIHSKERYVPAALAHDCLKSVPINPEDATHLITSYKSFVVFHSTLAWLKAPPPSYTLPPVDILGGLDNISATAAAKKYTSEYDFQVDILRLLSLAHDGHLGFRTDIFKLFGFRVKELKDVVSVSVDGKQLPKLYHYGDLAGPSGTVTPGNTTMPPAIVKINGEDAAAYIERMTMLYSFQQDADAMYNDGFPSYASPMNFGFHAGTLEYQGPTTVVTYDNGAQKTFQNVALVRSGVNLTGIQTGEDVYAHFCAPVWPDPPAPANATSAPGAPGAPGAPSPAKTHPAPVPPTMSAYYPWPVIRDNGGNTTSGYFLNGTGYDDVAVLSMSGFSAEGPGVDDSAYLNNVQDVIKKFFAACREAKKKRLVIDLSGNGGGTVALGYDLYTQLFPNATKFGASDFRLHESMLSIAKTANAHLSEIVNFDPDTAHPSTPAEENLDMALNIMGTSSLITGVTVGNIYTPTGANITTVDGILGPVELKGDKFSAYLYEPLNLTDPIFNQTGVGNQPKPASSPFAPENIVLLTDGTCGSTCTLFAYLMIFGQNVKTITVGGRPATGPMQSVGGVEGAELFVLEELSSVATAAIWLDPKLNVTGSQMQLMDDGYALQRTMDATKPGGVNGKNAFGPTDMTTPLQFLYQPANCRVFYTKDMVKSALATWMRVVDAWKDPTTHCVEGSIVPLNVTSNRANNHAFTKDHAVALAVG